MKTLISITIFVYAIAFGSTLLASGLLEQFGNVRKITEIIRIHEDKENQITTANPPSEPSISGSVQTITQNNDSYDLNPSEGATTPDIDSAQISDDDPEDESDDINEEEEK